MMGQAVVMCCGLGKVRRDGIGMCMAAKRSLMRSQSKHPHSLMVKTLSEMRGMFVPSQ